MCDSIFTIDDKTKIMTELQIVDVSLRNIELKIDHEKEEREKKDKEITGNYIARFGDMKLQIRELKLDIKDYIKDIGKKITATNWIVALFALSIIGVTVVVIFAKIWGWI